MTPAFIPARDVAALLEYPSTAAFLRRRPVLEERHGFPAPLPLQGRPYRWRRADVVDWLDRLGREDHTPAPDRNTEVARQLVLLNGGRA